MQVQGLFLIVAFFSVLDVGGYFETGTLVRYDFLPEATVVSGSASEVNLTREELLFSFSTSSTPSILVYVSSWTHDYMAVVLRHNGGTWTHKHQ